jgi:FtsH-binding integral membrane protein
MSSLSYRSVSELNDSMIRVYNHMCLAVLNSMIVGYLVSTNTQLMATIFGTPLKWVVIFAPLVVVLLVSFTIDKVGKVAATLMLHVFAALMGLSFATIFVIYTIGSITSAFMGAAVLFGTMSFYGYFTKRSLETMGQFMFIGLIAIVIASIINIFIGSTVMTMVISAIAIIIFLGLTAYDTQNIREQLSISTDGNAEVVGALRLYLDFINLFLNILQLFGIKKD